MGAFKDLDSAHRELVRLWPRVAEWVAVSERHWPDDYESERDYKIGNLYIRLSLARGTLFLNIAPRSLPTCMFSINLLRDHLEPPKRGRWRLSTEESMSFLSRSWEQVQEFFSPERQQVAVNALEHTCKVYDSNDYNLHQPLAILDASREGDAKRVRELLGLGTCPDSPDIFTGHTPLHLAIVANSIEIVTLLLDAGADVNHRTNKTRTTPLECAVVAQRLPIVRDLLARGAILTPDGISILDIARNESTPEIAAVLEQHSRS